MGSILGERTARAVLAGVAGLLLVGSAVAEEVEVGCVDDGRADFTLLVDGNTSCGNVAGMYGCRIGDSVGTCDFISPDGKAGFTATAWRDPVTGKYSFETEPYVTGTGETLRELYVDFTGAGGAEQGGACGRIYKPETVSGKEMAFVKSNQGVQKTTYLDVCTDLSNQPPVPVVDPPNVCDADVFAALTSRDDAVEGGDGIPDFAIVGYIDDPNKTAFCVGNDAFVEGCVNLQSDADSPRLPGVRYCDEGPDENLDGEADGLQPWRRNMTFEVTKTGENSQIFVCVPPPMTLDGTESCGWVYY
jgi:hypothetical protein